MKLLGLAIMKPCTSYEIRKEFEMINYSWWRIYQRFLEENDRLSVCI